MADGFREDDRLRQIAEAYALDAVDVALANFNTVLDFSDASIELVEEMLGVLHDTSRQDHPTDEQIWVFAKTFGSYIGETFRRNHGGRWGMVTLRGQEFPGMQAMRGTAFWPWGKAHNRIVNGPEDNVRDYYNSLLT